MAAPQRPGITQARALGDDRHAQLDRSRDTQHAKARLARIAYMRGRQRDGKQHRLMPGKIGGALAEIVSARFLRPVNAAAELGDIEIDLDHAILGPDQRHDIGKRQLKGFGHIAAPVPQIEVLRHLHRDGAGAAHRAGFDRLAHRAPIDAPMPAKAAVLARDHGERQLWRHVLERHPFTVQRRARQLVGQHHGGDRRIDEAEDDDGKEERQKPKEHDKRRAPEPGMPRSSRSALAPPRS